MTSPSILSQWLLVSLSPHHYRRHDFQFVVVYFVFLLTDYATMYFCYFFCRSIWHLFFQSRDWKSYSSSQNKLPEYIPCMSSPTNRVTSKISTSDSTFWPSKALSRIVAITGVMTIGWGMVPRTPAHQQKKPNAVSIITNSQSLHRIISSICHRYRLMESANVGGNDGANPRKIAARIDRRRVEGSGGGSRTPTSCCCHCQPPGQWWFWIIIL